MLRLIFAIGLIVFGVVQSFRGAFYLLLFYLGFAYFRPETWIWGPELQSLNLSFLIGAALVLAVLLSSTEKIRFSTPIVLIILFCLHGLVSSALSGHFAWSFFWWKGFAKVTVICVLIASLVNTADRFRMTLLVMAFALGLEGVKQGWFYLLYPQGDVNQNGVEILGDNNGVAVGMLMLSAVLLALLQTHKGLTRKGLFGFMLLGTIFRALTTYSRGGLLAFGAMLAVYWARSKRKIATALLVAVAGGGLLASLPQAYWDRMDTITADEADRDASIAGRLYFWTVAVRMANDHPLLGVGHTGFQEFYDYYDTSVGKYGDRRAVHSTWFGILAEQGYVGLLMLVSILALAFRASGRARAATKKLPQHENLFFYAGAIQTALVTFVVGGTFLSYHYVEILWHFIGLSFAIEQVVAYELTKQPVVATVQPPAAAAGFGPLMPAPAASMRTRG